jgi:hypothetical protein
VLVSYGWAPGHGSIFLLARDLIRRFAPVCGDSYSRLRVPSQYSPQAVRHICSFHTQASGPSSSTKALRPSRALVGSHWSPRVYVDFPFLRLLGVLKFATAGIRILDYTLECSLKPGAFEICWKFGESVQCLVAIRSLRHIPR